jgi:hypothetical protein
LVVTSNSRTQDISEEHEINPGVMKLAHHKQKWLNHVSRMEGIRYPKQLLTIDLLENEDLDNH